MESALTGLLLILRGRNRFLRGRLGQKCNFAVQGSLFFCASLIITIDTISVKLEKASNAFSGFAFTPSLPPSSSHFSFHEEALSLRPLPATGCNTHIFTWKISPSKKGWSPFKIIQIIYFFTSTQVYMCPKIWDFIPFHSYL